MLDNIASLALLRSNPQIRIGNLVPTGESAAHRALKLFVAHNPTLLGLSERALAEVEHSFITGDRVDLLFNNHAPQRTVVEVELSGEDQITTGIHQAIKYRSLAEAENDFPRLSPQVRAAVVAFETDYQFLRNETRAAPRSPESLLIGGPIQENPEKVRRANPIRYVTGDDPPFLILHGARDDLVPLNQSELLHRALKAAGVESVFHRLEGAGHGGPAFASAETMKMVEEFFDRHLRGGDQPRRRAAF